MEEEELSSSDEEKLEVEDIFNYSNTDYIIGEFIQLFKDELPVLIYTTTGFYGMDNIHTYNKDEVYRVEKIIYQPRAIANDAYGRRFSIPRDYKEKFVSIRPDGKKSSPGTLDALIKDWTSRSLLMEKFKFVINGNPNVSHSEFGSMEHWSSFGYVKYEDVYDEPYLVVRVINHDRIGVKVSVIPGYMNLDVALITGMRKGTQRDMARYLYETTQEMEKVANDYKLNEDVLLLPKYIESKTGEKELILPSHYLYSTHKASKQHFDKKQKDSHKDIKLQYAEGNWTYIKFVRPDKKKKTKVETPRVLSPGPALPVRGMPPIHKDRIPRPKKDDSETGMPSIYNDPKPTPKKRNRSRDPSPPKKPVRDGTTPSKTPLPKAKDRIGRDDSNEKYTVIYGKNTSLPSESGKMIKPIPQPKQRQKKIITRSSSFGTLLDKKPPGWKKKEKIKPGYEHLKANKDESESDEHEYEEVDKAEYEEVDKAYEIKKYPEILMVSPRIPPKKEDINKKKRREEGRKITKKQPGDKKSVMKTSIFTRTKKPKGIKETTVVEQSPYGTMPLYKTLADVPKDISKFSVHRLADCLRLLTMAEHVDKFIKNHVDGALFQSLDEKDLVSNFGLNGFQVKQLLKFRDGWRPLLD